MSQPQRKKLSLDDQFIAAKGMALIAKEIDGMPDGPEKEAQKSRFKERYDSFMGQHEMPLIETSPFSFRPNPLKVVDYGSGLLRTGVGETGLALAGKNNIPDAAERVARAVNPLDRPALGMREYLDLGGAGNMGTLQDAEGNYKVTGKGAAGFAGDMLLNPAMVVGGLKALLAREAAPVAPQITADVMREAERNAKDAASKAMTQPTSWSDVWGGAKRGFSAAMDPLTALREKLLAMRFKNADDAVQLSESGGKIVGRPLPSQIFKESGANGITSKQIRQDMRAIVERNGQRIDSMVNEISDIAPDFGITRGTPEMATNPQLLDPKSAMYPLYSPEQAARERTPFIARESQAARRQIESDFRSAAEGDPGLMRQLEEQKAQQGSQVFAPNGQILNDRQQFLPGMQPPKPTTTNIPGLMRGPEGEWLRTERPITINEGQGPAVAPKISTDPLSVDEFYPLPKVSEMASNAQGRAAERKFFLSRDRFSPDAPQTPPLTRGELAAEGGLYAEQGQHLRQLQEDLMDEARPGLGGDAHRINQRTSSLLEGGSYLDRPKPTPAAGKATSRSKQAFGGVPMMAVNTFGDATKPVMMAGYQALRSPWVTSVAAPAARAYWLENFWNNEYKDTPENPWALIQKYGAQQ